MSNKPDHITFTADDGEEVVFEVLEQTRLGGADYLLVSTGDEEDAEAIILKDISKDMDTEAIYEVVEDEGELELVSDLFRELLDDIELY